ncbi:VWA domain-containing protein [Salipiger sp. 1_MG-2023]|uniref:VWA domain-containing protein n=1 Tax=Salipiger sp. 1_MG-2023 TaxID=3062665 RepID=UPI0026E418F5|nr:VWA domain-containing protein [Salipiger sp. 1_MG-2023]MDO6585839.1 VWA domain-containing protein [Salipiger sp. 1_MG-2023]
MPDFIGTDASETLNGIDGTDRLTGLGGDDTIDGRPQEDISVYRGNFADYTVEFLDTGAVRITDSVANRDGTDLLTSVEYAEFTDMQVGLRSGQDIAIVVDTTGSMYDDIAAVKSSALNLLDAIFAPENGLYDSRIAIVGFNDPGTNVVLEFTDDADPEDRKIAAIAAINSLRANGGGDFPELTFKGLQLALDGSAGDWRPDATASRIFIFGDASAKDESLEDAVYALAADVPALTGESNTPLRVQISTITLGGSRAALDDFARIANATGGEALTAANASDLVDVLLTAIVSASDADDFLTGTARPNLLDGLGGNDTIDGREGNDTLLGRDGDDLLISGQDNDRIWGGTGNDTIEAGAGGDTASGGPGDDLIDGHRDNDLLRGNDGNDTVRGGIGDDTVLGGRGDDLLSGNQGNDTAYGGDGNDDIRGWGGDDSLLGGGGADLIAANEGDDTAYGGAGSDTISGGDGNDQLAGNRDADVLYGEFGADLLRGGIGDDLIFGGRQNDTLRGNEGADLLRGGNGDDMLYGGDGNDVLIGGTGADSFFGGDGADAVSYAGVAVSTGAMHLGVRASLQDPSMNAGGASGDSYASVEILIGSGFDDHLIGNAFDNHLFGGDWNDTLEGGDGDDLLQGGDQYDTLLGGTGDDTLQGGYGRDTLTGGAGADVFFFDRLEAVDVITDFELGTDLLRIRASSWTGGTLDEASLAAMTSTDGDSLTIGLYDGSIVLEGITSTDALLADIELF